VAQAVSRISQLLTVAAPFGATRAFRYVAELLKRVSQQSHPRFESIAVEFGVDEDRPDI
jgi:hypothetical protein